MQGKVEICGVNTARLKVLKNEETRQLLLRAKAGDAAAREELISGNLRLVLSVLQRFSGRGENLDDLFQVGCIGLIKAIDNFDVSQPVKFSTYGVPTIIGWRNPESEVFSMTRKQALSLAIRALSAAGRNEEAVRVLRSLSEDLPLSRWSDAAIRDSVDQFILDHGRVPTVTDFKGRGLPPHTVIEHRYEVTLRQWLDENYPSRKPPAEDVRKRMTAAFVKDYLRIRPKSADGFNAERTPGTPCWTTVARRHHTRRWRELLEKLELPVFGSADPAPPAFRVNVYTHYDFRD